jgi:tetratricopeptide (TPR) repeat protein
VHAWIVGRAGAADDDWARAAEHAERAGDEAALLAILSWRSSAALFGPAPAPEAIARCRALGDRMAHSPLARARTLHPLAALHAMAGDRDEALRVVREADEVLLDVGDLRTSVGQEAAIVDVLCDRPEAAEARLRHAFEQLAAMGEKALLADTAAMLARVLHDLGRDDEAAEACAVGEDAAADDDLSAQVGWRGVRAMLLAAEGRMGEAEALARDAVGRCADTDFLTLRAEALTALGDVLGRAGRHNEADATLAEAVALYTRKGDVASAARLRTTRLEDRDAAVPDGAAPR